MIDAVVLQRLSDLPIEGVAELLGLQVHRHWALCPFHADKRPSLYFRVAKNKFKCFVCGQYGGVIDLVMGVRHIGFEAACQWLLGNIPNGGDVEFSNSKNSSKKETLVRGREVWAQLVADPVLTDEAKRFLFDERKLDPRVIAWCGISSTHDHLLIPYFDADGNFVSIQWRNLKPAAKLGPSETRFRFPIGSHCSIYGLQVLKLLKNSEPLFICEGASDCWAMLSSGHKAIAIPSATLLKPEDLKPLETCHLELGSVFHMYPDQDEPGLQLFSQLHKLLPNLQFHALPAGCKDFSDYYLKMLNCENVNL